ncbi:MAG: hypothetical protein RSF34_03185 [Flavobacterium sp.]|uniref:hypothetical protein n=1 Tax=unclassified Flavobacterium TaxID=196869 RepID=UPI000C19F090|nr:hypothetical protein [Flavobacterium sp. 2]PIF70389.1 hypothetical protein CLU99_1123 [Flavobacterium sp. 2]
MKLIVCLFLFLIPTLNYGFKKREIPYSIVILKADLIVDGTVSKVSKDSYEFTVTQFVKGKSNSKIKVSIWKEWLCDPRIVELKAGQRLILFLEKLANGNFYPINESTGELYVDNNCFINIFLPKDFSNPTVLKKGISMFLKTYQCYGDLNNRFLENVYFLSNKSIFEVYKMKEINSAFSFLSDSVEYYGIKEIPINLMTQLTS